MNRLFVASILFTLTLFSCKKDTASQQTLAIPNGNFELWNAGYLLNWQTNSCPYCVPPFETDVVQQVSDAESGQYAAQFISSPAYNSFATNGFAISVHPTSLTGYIKSKIGNGDTAMIYVDLFSGSTLVDSGNFYDVKSINKYQKITIPITQNSITADSAFIRITLGNTQNAELYVDNLIFLKN